MSDDPYAGLGTVMSAPNAQSDDPYAGLGTVVKSPDTPKEYGTMGFLKAINKSLVGNLVTGVGQSAAAARFPGSENLNNAGQWLADTGHSIEQKLGVDDNSYGVSHSSQFHLNDPKSWVTEGPYALAETLPSAGVSLAMPELKGLGFIGSETAQHYGQNVAERMANQPPGAEPSASDQGAALASTVGQAVVGRYGLHSIPSVNNIPLLSKVAPSLTKGLGTGAKAEVAKVARDFVGAAGANAAASTAGDLIDQAGRNIGTANGQSSPDWTEAGNAAGLGAFGGAVMRGALLPGDVRNAMRMSPLGGPNAQASADLAYRLGKAQSGEDPNTSEGASRAHQLVSTGLDQDTQAATKAAGSILTDSNPVTGDIKQAQTRLAAGQVLPESTLSSIESGLGPEGAPLAHLIRVQNAQNIVKGFGNFTNDEHQGGILGSSLGKFTDPGRLLHSVGGVHAAPINILGTLALGHEALSAVGGNTLAAMVLAGLAARPAFKGIDTVLGNRNPTGQFMQRFAGQPFTAPSGLSQANSGPPTSVPSVGNRMPFQTGPGPWGAIPQPQGPGIASPLTNAALAQIKLNANTPKQGPGIATPLGNPALGQIALNKALAKASPASPKAPKGRTDMGGSMGPVTTSLPASAEPTPSPSGPPGYIPPARPVSPAEVQAFIAKANAKPAKASPKAPEATDTIVPVVKTPEGTKAAPEAPQEPPADITVTHRGETVNRPLVDSNGIRVKDVEAYKSGIVHNIDARANMRDDLKVVLPKGAHGGGAELVDALMKDLHSRHMTQDRAQIRIEKFFEQVPASKKTAVAKILGRHIPRIMDTYDQ